ncbi:MAG: hypothetical protein V4553_13065 [Bacteroidota bacterium]
MTKKYILKPGKHQFAPGSAAIHNNDNITDKEARWYLKAYPHIRSLFIQLPGRKAQSKQVKKSEEAI